MIDFAEGGSGRRGVLKAIMGAAAAAASPKVAKKVMSASDAPLEDAARLAARSSDNMRNVWEAIPKDPQLMDELRDRLFRELINDVDGAVSANSELVNDALVGLNRVVPNDPHLQYWATKTPTLRELPDSEHDILYDMLSEIKGSGKRRPKVDPALFMQRSTGLYDEPGALDDIVNRLKATKYEPNDTKSIYDFLGENLNNYARDLWDDMD